MANNEEREAQIKAAYKKLDDVVRELVTLEVTDKGLVTDYCVVTAVQAYDDNGNMMDMVEPILPDQGRLTPRYRTFGLLKDMMTQFEAVSGHVTLAALHQTMEEDDDE